MRRRLGTAALTVLLVTTISGAAQADTGENLPAGADPAAWASYVEEYRAGPDWAPGGTVVADSRFRSFPDGFSFFNTGVPDSYNNAIFGTSLNGPPNLDADAMRDLLGKRVCVEKSATGPCTLTLSAQQWMKSTNQVMAGGHCFGFASTAAELFNRTLRPGQFQANARTAYDLQLREPISRQIARNMATQFTFDLMEYTASPRKVLSTLRKNLQPGTMPYTLFIFWPGGGHALTPYAVYDRGAGLYDIAVYDNNYPDAERAIRVDTGANTYRYLVSTNPNGGAEIAKDLIGLVPSSLIAKRQKCPFCPAANETTVQLTPVRTRVPVRTRITDLEGRPIPGVVINRPTNPWQPGRKWEFPTYTVPRRQAFVISVRNTRNSKDITTSLLATTGQFTVGTEGARIPARGVGLLGLVPDKGVVVYNSDGRQRDLGALVFVDESPSSAVQVTARTGSTGDQLLLGRFDEVDKRVVIYTPSQRSAPAEASAILQYAGGGGAGLVQAEAKTTIPLKGRLVIDYSRWSANRPTAVSAYLLAGGRRTTVPLTLTRG